jgi:hypothetical protein
MAGLGREYAFAEVESGHLAVRRNNVLATAALERGADRVLPAKSGHTIVRYPRHPRIPEVEKPVFVLVIQLGCQHD